MSKPRSNQVSRMYVELQLLQTTRFGLTTKQIHERIQDRFSVSVRTVYRDLEALQRAGFPLLSFDPTSSGQHAVKWAARKGALMVERQLLVQEDELHVVRAALSASPHKEPAVAGVIRRIELILGGEKRAA
jgi:predicted DNA-binding transcriptional regulator YafY